MKMKECEIFIECYMLSRSNYFSGDLEIVILYTIFLSIQLKSYHLFVIARNLGI
jgi:hypothetical protein